MNEFRVYGPLPIEKDNIFHVIVNALRIADYTFDYNNISRELIVKLEKDESVRVDIK